MHKHLAQPGCCICCIGQHLKRWRGPINPNSASRRSAKDQDYAKTLTLLCVACRFKITKCCQNKWTGGPNPFSGVATPVQICANLCSYVGRCWLPIIIRVCEIWIQHARPKQFGVRYLPFRIAISVENIDACALECATWLHVHTHVFCVYWVIFCKKNIYYI